MTHPGATSIISLLFPVLTLVVGGCSAESGDANEESQVQSELSPAKPAPPPKPVRPAPPPAPSGSSGGGSSKTCSFRGSNNSDTYAADCVDGTCSCSKNGVAAASCTPAPGTSGCDWKVNQGTVTLGCCQF